MAGSLSDLISPRKKVLISDGAGAAVELDVSIEETHEGASDVTDYPVEQGPNIADNSRPKPRTLTIHAAVTGTPIDIGPSYAMPPAIKAQRGKKAWTQLDTWRQVGQRLSVTTTFFGYVDLVITSITVPRSAQNTDGVEFTISFKQVFTVKSKTVAKPTRKTNKPVEKNGSKSTKNASKTVGDKSASTAKDISDGVGKLLGIKK